MSKIGISICFLLVVLATPLRAQEQLSFRNRALGGIVNDDLDLVYDPIELRFVDTLHLYTNLSNLTSTHEQIYNGISDNEFLIGASRKNPLLDNLWTALLFRFQKSKAANPISIDTDLNGVADDFGEGTLQDEYTAYLDLNGNGLYDLKRSISQLKSSTRETDGYSFVLNNSFQIGGNTIGLKIVFGDQAVEQNIASSPLGTGRGMLFGTSFLDPTFNHSVEEFLIDSNYTSLRWSENGDFKTDQENPLFRIATAFMVPSDELEFRGDVEFHTIGNSTETDDTYLGGYEYYDPHISGYTRKYSESAGFSGSWNSDGHGFGFGGSTRYTFDRQPYRRNDGFVAVGIIAGFESFDYASSSASSSSSSETVFDGVAGPQVDFIRNTSRLSSQEDNGDGSSNTVQFIARLNVPLADGVMFGLGASYRIMNTERTTKYAEEFLSTTDHSRTDNAQNAFDTVRTENSALFADRVFKVKSRVFSVPVGVEYYFTENHHWALRFGSVFQYASQSTDDAMQITDSRPYITRTTLGNGVVTVNVRNNTYTSRSTRAVEGESRTFFTYGLGYFPTNNLQIDVLGFFDVSDNVTLLELLKSLRLSFVLKL